MSEDTHSHVALSHGEGLSGQHVRLHQILHVDPVHACPAIPKPEHEKSLLDVALVQGRGQCRLTGVFYALSTRSQLPISNGLDSNSTSQVLWTSLFAWLTDDLGPPLVFLTSLVPHPQNTCKPSCPDYHIFSEFDCFSPPVPLAPLLPWGPQQLLDRPPTQPYLALMTTESHGLR